MSTDTLTESSVEVIKRESDGLRGTLGVELSSPESRVSGDSEQLLKFHGIYAQDDRDVRRARALAKESLEYIFMVRVVVPGGRLSAAQWLALDDVATNVANGSLRLTTRQAVQFHGVTKVDLQTLARRLDEVMLSSFGGCGDVVRNVVCCPDLRVDDRADGLASLALRLRETFRSTSSAHWELFVNGERAASRTADDERPFYGDAYLPRKFKIAVANPEENCVDVFAQDLGLIPARGEHGAGFHVLVGGGLGRAYADTDTFARLATPLAFVAADEIDEVIAAVLTTYRDLGDRVNRKRARLKYVVHDLGPAAFRAEVEARLGRALRDPESLPELGAEDHLGWRRLDDGRWQVGLRVNAGRVRDLEGTSLRRALREIVERFAVEVLLTPQQNLIVYGVSEDERTALDALLVAHGVRTVEHLGAVERRALACPALPTCGQALTDAERRLPELVAGIEGELAARGLARRSVGLRLTGCPNGCARPAIAEVGVVGRTKSTYDLYLGGRERGDRLARVYREKVALEEIPGLLAPLFDRWVDEGVTDEEFGDFVTRVGVV